MSRWPSLIEPAMADVLSERRDFRAGRTPGPHRSGGPADVADGLRTWLREETGERDLDVSEVTVLAGGGSNELYSFVLTGGQAGPRRQVLRVKSRGSGVVTSILREFQLMRIAADVVPVATPRWATADTSYLGAPALVCDLVDGVQAPRGAARTPSAMGVTFSPALRGQLGPQFVDHLARLHAHDWRRGELSEFAVPRAGTTDAIDHQLSLLDAVWAEDRLEDHPTVAMTREWLWTHRPVVDQVSVLHGDYRNGNFLFDEDAARITAILDWELATLGDRHADLAYVMMRHYGSRDEDGVFLNANLVSTPDLVARYERVSGLPIDPDRLHYYRIFNVHWGNVSVLGTALMNARLGHTRLDVMYNLMAGLGVVSCDGLNRALGEW